MRITGRLDFVLNVGTRDGLGGGCVVAVAASVDAVAAVAVAVVGCGLRLSKEVRESLATRATGVASSGVSFVERECRERGEREAWEETFETLETLETPLPRGEEEEEEGEGEEERKFPLAASF